ncbi:MAG: endonuclease domain-containing protein [Chloroflexota bacterium]
MAQRPSRQRRWRTTEAVQLSAKVLRHELTPAERVLWDALRDRRLQGLKFRRQHPIGPFVADFCCVASRLVVEVDGEVHTRLGDRDAVRTAYLAERGYRVMRIPNGAVVRDLAEVLRRIAVAASLQEDGTTDSL